MPQQNSDARKTLKELVDDIKGVFKRHSRSARERAWDALTSSRAHKEIKELINNPSKVVNDTSRWLSFREWHQIDESAFQISRKQFYEILRWIQALRMNYGTNCRPGTDITKGDFGVKTTDPQRLIRIFQWGLDEFRKIERDFGGSIPPKPQDLQSGMYDDKIVPTLRTLSHIIRSMLVNFQQVGYSHENTEKVAHMLEPYKSL